MTRSHDYADSCSRRRLFTAVHSLNFSAPVRSSLFLSIGTKELVLDSRSSSSITRRTRRRLQCSFPFFSLFNVVVALLDRFDVIFPTVSRSSVPLKVYLLFSQFVSYPPSASSLADSCVTRVNFFFFYSRLDFNDGESGDDDMGTRASSYSYTSSSSRLYVSFLDTFRRYSRVFLFRTSFGESAVSLLAPYRYD